MSEATPEKTAPKIHAHGEGHHWSQPLVWGLGYWLSWIFCHGYLRFQVQESSRVPRTGGVLLVTNHQSFLDPLLVGVAAPRQVHFMARDTLFKGFFGRVISAVNAFPVKRGHGDLQAIRTAIARLEAGYLVNIFPEGTRSLDGSIGVVAPGVSLLVHRAKVPVLPVLIEGAFEAWPRSMRFPRSRKVRLRFGELLRYEELADLSADALAAKLQGKLIALQQEIGSPHAAVSLEHQVPAEGARESRRRRRPQG